ncbi:VCBS domain-containing protein [Pseudomonas nitroreducens]|uniref:VCBS domain-containing protein n=1 Tax=Pseudomonas nitroreducens TaxID=46680 RepID=UPI00351D49FD
MSESYQWDFGSAASGLQFKVVYDGASFTVTCISGYMDLNALWFSDGDKSVEGTVTLSKFDNSLNMNGTGITWDDFYKVSNTGLGSAGENKTSFLTASESMSFSVATLQLPDAILTLLSNHPECLTLGVRATSTSSLSGDGKFVDIGGTLITSVNNAPTLEIVSNADVNDTAGDDNFPNVTGTLKGNDSDGDTVSFELAGSSPTDGVGDSDGFDVQKSTDYGTFYLNTTSGKYKFVVNDTAVEGLKTTQELDFVVNATDGAADSATQTITISLNGVNDTPELSASLTSKTYVDTSTDDAPFVSVTGQLTTVDRDAGETATYAINGATPGSFDVNGHTYQQKLVGSFGTLYLDTSGAYEYVPDDGAIEGIKENTSEAFTLKVTDGSNATDTKTLTISLTGTNDKPELSANLTATTYDDTSGDDSFTSVTGQLTTADRDIGDTKDYSIDSAAVSTDPVVVNGHTYQQNLVGKFGTLYLDISGKYEYVPNDAAIEGLKTTSSENFTLKVTDGSGATDAKTLTITVNGVNDKPELSASLTAKTYVDTSGDDSFTSVTGQLTTTDRDIGDTKTYSIDSAAVGTNPVVVNGHTYQQNLVGKFGTLYLDISGKYEYVPNDSAIEGIKEDTSEAFTLKVTDGSNATDTKTLTISLTGANDKPELSASLTAKTYVDTSGNDSFTSVTGQLTTADRDVGDTKAYTIDSAAVAPGSFNINGHTYQQKLVGGFGTLYLDINGQYEYVPNDDAIEALEANASEGFTLQVTDGSGATDTKTLTINLTGAQDAPVVAPVTAAYTDTAADDTFADKTGTLAVTSRDGDTSFTFALDGSSASAVNGYDLQNTSSGYGTLYLNSSTGAYKFIANDTAIEELHWGTNPNLVYNVTAAADGVTSDSQTITIGLTGGNDAPRDLAMAAVSFGNGNGIPGVGDTVGILSVPANADPDAGGNYSYSLVSTKVGALGAASLTEVNPDTLFTVSTDTTNNTGVLSPKVVLANSSIYDVTVQVSQGSGATLASYSETFSIVTGTNTGTETLPGGGYDFSSGDDVIYGRNGTDIILAGSGNDTVFGQNGNDEIHGGTGVDLLYGGNGNNNENDSFVFASGDTGITLATADTIGDFNSAEDTIVTSSPPSKVTIADGTNLANFDAFLFAANTALANGAATNNAYVAWNAAKSGDGWLVIDHNGSGSVDNGDSLIVLVGVNTQGEFAANDIA